MLDRLATMHPRMFDDRRDRGLAIGPAMEGDTTRPPDGRTRPVRRDEQGRLIAVSAGAQNKGVALVRKAEHVFGQHRNAGCAHAIFQGGLQQAERHQMRERLIVLPCLETKACGPDDLIEASIRNRDRMHRIGMPGQGRPDTQCFEKPDGPAIQRQNS